MKLKNKIIPAAAAVVIIAAVVVLIIIGGKDPAAKISETLYGETGIEILGFEEYSGAYFEDGSDEEVAGVHKLTVRNKGETDYRLLQLCITDKNGSEYRFKLTTVLQGETMVVLEENRALFADMSKPVSISVEECVVFDTEPSTHTDVLSYMVMGSTVIVENISEEPITNLSVFYKNYSDGVAVGGITYMLNIPELPAGESREISTAHFDEETSRLVFAVYG